MPMTIRKGWEISTHAPRTGSDRIAWNSKTARFYFNPRSPHGERLEEVGRAAGYPAYFNPRSPHGERHCPAPRTGKRTLYFNPRSPHGERLETAHVRDAAITFQPTLPARGATDRGRGHYQREKHFNPRSPHGERPADKNCKVLLCYFNPRSPHGERRTETPNYVLTLAISTHAPRTGSDVCLPCTALKRNNFNPRSPHGERLPPLDEVKGFLVFQPTLPARGATPPRSRPALPR